MLADTAITEVFSHPGADREGRTPRAKWRETLGSGLHHSGALSILRALSRRYEFAPTGDGKAHRLRRAKRAKFAILCYHRVGIGGIPFFSELLPELFEAQVRYLRRFFRILSLDDLCEEMQSGHGTDNGVAVTFDDGYADLFTHAMPVLKTYKIPATIYLPVASIETGEVPWYDRIFLALQVYPGKEFEIFLSGPQKLRLDSTGARLRAAAEIIQYLRTVPDASRRERCQDIEKTVSLPGNELKDRMLNWNQVRTMYRSGVSFGSHTMTHPVVSQLTVSQMESELEESKTLLEQRLSNTVRHFAFPFGKPEDCGTNTSSVLNRLGYRSASTTVEGLNWEGDDLFELRRTQIVNEASISMFACKLNQLFFAPGRS
jgi:peptidoglycan/xylan/chitin deacetylase (PgdA/CDA1 family)